MSCARSVEDNNVRPQINLALVVCRIRLNGPQHMSSGYIIEILTGPISITYYLVILRYEASKTRYLVSVAVLSQTIC